MSTTHPDDILLPTSRGATDTHPDRSRLVAFVPITIAVIGVAAILVGRVTVHEIARNETAYGNAVHGVDPVTTGSIRAVDAAD